MTRADLGTAAPSIVSDDVDADMALLEDLLRRNCGNMPALVAMNDRLSGALSAAVAGGGQSPQPAAHEHTKRMSDHQPLAVIASLLGWTERRTSNMLRDAGLKIKLGKARSAPVTASMSAVEKHMKLPAGTLAARAAGSGQSNRNHKTTKKNRQSSS